MSEAWIRAKAQQAVAADPDASVFVTANAGSGKTKVLIDRVARLLLAGGAPSAFLCITYTKAAAAEMQRRLFSRLGAWCVARDDVLAQELADLGEIDSISPKALARARALFARALETPGGLRIQTIHAFCERLIGRFPLEAGVAPGFSIADEAEQKRMLQEAWARAAQLPETREALARLCARLDSERFQALLASLAAQRAKLGTAQNAAQAIASRHGDPPPMEVLHQDGLAHAPWKTLAQAQDILLAGGIRDGEAGQRIAASRLAPHDFAAYRAIFFKQTDGEPHKASPTTNTRKNAPWLGQMFEEEVRRLGAIDQRLKARARMEDSLAAQILGQELISAYALAKKRAGLLDFEDLIASALHLLADGPAAAWVLYKLDGGIDHILIDEGQDTSPSQWALLAPLQEEFFAGEGARGSVRRTVFAVGDPKQSIYSFQGADPAGFLAQAQALSAQAHGAQMPFVAPSLGMSFRSCPEVLEVVDAVLADQPLGGDTPGVFDKITHTTWRAEQTGLVQVWPAVLRPQSSPAEASEAPQEQEQAIDAPALLGRAIADAIKGWIAAGDGVWENRKLRPMHAGDVLILVKKRGKEFEAVLRALKRAGLPVAGADRISLPHELAVQDALACMRVALDPGDDLALACVLKGPFLGQVDAEEAGLFALAQPRAKGESLMERLRAASDPRFAPAQAFVEGLIARRAANPFQFLAHVLESVDGEGHSGWHRMLARLGEEARDPLEELLAKALAAPAMGLGNLWAFLGAMSADSGTIKREGEETGRAVRVMTVHGAKGLEAPIVFLADSAGEPGGSGESLFWDEAGPVLAGAGKEDDQVSAACRQAEQEAQAREHLRLLYVALTRAQDRLIVCAAAKGHGEGKVGESSWHALVERTLSRLGEPITTPFGEGFQLGQRLLVDVSPDAPRKTHPSPAPDWLTRPAALSAPAATAPRPSARFGAAMPASDAAIQRFTRGRMIHGLLQRLPDIAPERREKAGLAWLMRQGCTAEAAAAYFQEAAGVLAHPDCAAAFGPGSRAEQPVIGLGQRGIVDRLLINPKEIWILEFKTDRPAPKVLEQVDPRYLEQIRSYQSALATAFPARAIHSALIWTQAPHVMAVPPWPQ